MSTFSKNMFQGINMTKSWYQKRTDKKRIDCLMETKEHIKVDTPVTQPAANGTFDMDAAEIHEMQVAIEELEPVTPEPDPEEVPAETVAEAESVVEEVPTEPEPVKVEEPVEAPAEEQVAKSAPKKSKKKNS